MTGKPGTRTRRTRGDDGSSLLTAGLALLVFFVLLLFAVQLLVDLYQASVVTSAAHDGARVVASADVDHGDAAAVTRARTEAERRIRSLLGPRGATADIDWSRSTSDEVVVRVQVDAPRFGVERFNRHVPFTHIDRTARARVEELR